MLSMLYVREIAMLRRDVRRTGNDAHNIRHTQLPACQKSLTRSHRSKGLNHDSDRKVVRARSQRRWTAVFHQPRRLRQDLHRHRMPRPRWCRSRCGGRTHLLDQMGIPSANDGSIERVDLDGGNRTTIVPNGGTYTPKQLHLDPVGPQAVLV